MPETSSTVLPPGTAPIKAEYLISFRPLSIPDDDAAEGNTTTARGFLRNDEQGQKQNIGPQRRRMTKEEKKAMRGANKGRRFGKTKDDVDLCWRVANGSECEYGPENCRFSHDIPTYLAAKLRDIRIASTSEIADVAPFLDSSRPASQTHPKHLSLDLGTTCPVFAETGECRYGFKCRFLGGHIRINGDDKLELVADEDRKARALSSAELNFLGADIRNSLRTKKYPLPFTTAYLNDPKNIGLKDVDEKAAKISDSMIVIEPEQQVDDKLSLDSTLVQNGTHEEIIMRRTGESLQPEDMPDVPLRYLEKKRLHWSGKTYLAPLTTVGNLPFRRVCVSLGADITCGEMGLATSFLAGSKEEWSLVRRHPSEKIFGVQIAGNKPANLVPTAEVIARELAGGVDFVDLNCGCPIDLVFRAGSGSALIDAPGKLGRILVGMNKALGEIPVTVKLRTGVKDGKNTAHKLMPRIATEWNASCMTLHGRTRQQRYTRLADWDYIRQCVEAIRAREEEEDSPHIPIFGGGDCYSAHDYYSDLESSGVDGVMVARGALIKPWIFTEIKEHREWDISARERLDLIRDYANYGLNHFGTDTTGVNTTRRYLCEALSFQYRYVPIGLLERLPGKINERAPAFRGRSDLETLLSSGDSRDWVKISEMFLGPAPESWVFTPKHKSNAYETQG